jgi:ferric-dicitrate binding protein FerR (iron transport regulator)
MNRKAFYHLLKRYVENDCTEEERKLVEQWYELLGDEEGVDLAMPPQELQESLQRLWPKIQQQTVLTEQASPVPSPAKIIPVWVRWVSAAVIAGGIIIAGWLYLNNRIIKVSVPHQREMAGLQQVKNDKIFNDTVQLPDGSLVILEPAASVRFRKSFARGKREVYLEMPFSR